MQGKRADRISELIRMELSSVLLKQVRDPGLGFITITRVETSADMQHAKVFYSVMGTLEQRQKTQKALDRARGFLQRDIAGAINLRYTPHLNFILDDSADKGMEIEGILKKLHAGQERHNAPDVE